jgi:hypothetical protein
VRKVAGLIKLVLLIQHGCQNITLKTVRVCNVTVVTQQLNNPKPLMCKAENDAFN